MASKHVFGFTPEFLKAYDNETIARLTLLEKLAASFENGSSVTFHKIVEQTISISCEARPAINNEEEICFKCFKTISNLLLSSSLDDLKNPDVVDWTILQSFDDESKNYLFNGICYSGQLGLLKYIRGAYVGVDLVNNCFSNGSKEDINLFLSHLEQSESWHVYYYILNTLNTSLQHHLPWNKETVIEKMRKTLLLKLKWVDHSLDIENLPHENIITIYERKYDPGLSRKCHFLGIPPM